MQKGDSRQGRRARHQGRPRVQVRALRKRRKRRSRHVRRRGRRILFRDRQNDAGNDRKRDARHSRRADARRAGRADRRGGGNFRASAHAGAMRRSRRKPLLRRLLQRLPHFDEGRPRALPENFRRQRTAPFPARLHGGTGARRAPPPQGNRLQSALPRGRQGGARRRKRRNLQARNGRIPVAGRRDRNLCGFRLRKRFRGRLQGLGIRKGQPRVRARKRPAGRRARRPRFRGRAQG